MGKVNDGSVTGVLKICAAKGRLSATAPMERRRRSQDAARRGLGAAGAMKI